MKPLLMTALLALGLCACGGTDNVGKCQNVESQLICGDWDPTKAIDCEAAFKGLNCDLSQYWTCLTGNFSCQDNQPDTSKWAECAQYAVCSD